MNLDFKAISIKLIYGFKLFKICELEAKTLDWEKYVINWNKYIWSPSLLSNIFIYTNVGPLQTLTSFGGGMIIKCWGHLWSAAPNPLLILFIDIVILQWLNRILTELSHIASVASGDKIEKGCHLTDGLDIFNMYKEYCFKCENYIIQKSIP